MTKAEELAAEAFRVLIKEGGTQDVILEAILSYGRLVQEAAANVAVQSQMIALPTDGSPIPEFLERTTGAFIRRMPLP